MIVMRFGGVLTAALIASTGVTAQTATPPAADCAAPDCQTTAEGQAPAAASPAAPASPAASQPTPAPVDPVSRGFGDPAFDPAAADGPPIAPMLARLDAAGALGAAAAPGILLAQTGDGRPSELSSVVVDEAEAGAGVEVTRVTLATGGLAQVEGEMQGEAETMRLAIERPQIADVLRTLVVSGTAPVVSIDLEAAEPVGERSATGRLLAGDLADPITILESLIGAEVTISGGPRQLSGRLLAYSLVTLPATEEDGAAPGVRIAVATDGGSVAYAVFPSLDQLAIEGAAVAERMGGLVPALSERIDDGRRDLEVRLAEPAVAGFSFVVPTTVWRPSYRALIDTEGETTLQGWATLENTTGLDWNGIDLRLAVGTPVAYAQDVYSPLRTARPRAPFEVGRTAETGLVPSEETAFADLPMAAEAAPAPMRLNRMASRVGAAASAADLVTGGPATAGTAVTTFPVAGAIDLAAGRTLSVPFLQNAETAERITYLDLVAGGQPFDSLELSFDHEATVPGGLVAVYEGDTFVGDARFAGADGGAVSILPFAVSADLKATTRSRTLRNLTSASLTNGGLRLAREEVTTTILAVAAADEVALVTDVSRIGGDTVTARAEGLEPSVVEIDSRRARVRVTVPAGQHTITIEARRPLYESYVLSDIPTPIIEEVLSFGGAVEEATLERLRAIRTITSDIAAIEREIAAAERETEALRGAVEFDRDNLEAIDASTPEGREVRQRIISRTEDLNALLERVSGLRRERLELTTRLATGLEPDGESR